MESGTRRNVAGHAALSKRKWALLAAGAQRRGDFAFDPAAHAAVHNPYAVCVLLRPFGVPSLLWQLTLSAALAVHVLFNLRPLLLDSGMDPDARMQRWVRTVCVLALLAAAVGAVCYAVGVKL